MTDRPILFSGPMVRALLAGTKTQTRRIFKGIERMPNGSFHIFGGMVGVSEEDVPKHAPDYIRIQVGDRLWVRESWKATGLVAFNRPSETRICGRFAYMADEEQLARDAMIPWRPSIHMPRWASRLTLTVTDVRVERLNDCSEPDAIAEGIERLSSGLWSNYDQREPSHEGFGFPTNSYRALWDSINGTGSWDDNPWIVAYTFTVHRGNIDQIAKVAA